MSLKKWMSMDKKEVIYKSQDDKVGIISKTQPAQKVAEISNTRILPAGKTGQKPAQKDAPKKLKSGAKKIMKLNTDYSKVDKARPFDKARLGKPYIQQPGRKPGEGAGKIVAKPAEFPETEGKLDFDKVGDIEIDGVDIHDYPDFCDAFIQSATYAGREMTEKEIELLEGSGFVNINELAHESIQGYGEDYGQER